MLRRAVGAAPAFLKEQFVINFRDKDLGITSLLTRSDKDLGGFSTVDLSLVDNRSDATQTSDATSVVKTNGKAGADPEVYGVFSGDLSLDLPEDQPEIVKLGYTMFRTKDKIPKWFGFGSDEYYDWNNFSQVALRVRGDRRKYFVNIQAETPYPTDLYQHRLFLKNIGQWEVVTIPFSNFILTNGGVIQQQSPMDIEHIRSIGVGLIDGQYGPYRLDIDWVKVIAGNFDQKVEQPDAYQAEEVSPEEPAHVEGPLSPGKKLPMD